MKRERGEEFLLIALVVSVMLHIAAMVMIKTQVMTHVTSSGHRAKNVPMKVTEVREKPDAATIAEILDLDAAKDEPAAKQEDAVSRLPSSEALPVPSTVPKVELAAVPDLKVPPAPVFDSKATASGKYEMPAVVASEVMAVPYSDLRVSVAEKPSPSLPSAQPAAQPPQFDESLLAADSVAVQKMTVVEKAPEFKPTAEVFKEVNEKAVAQEKAAVRHLVNQDNARELEKFVNVVMTGKRIGGEYFFRVMMTPRTELRTVPKDLVILIDASGSIGRDRMGSIRSAAKKILKDVTNTGDRFNLVAFRDRFSYAFTAWQDCTVQSFDAAEKWLNAVAPHGRTDVFSTISSVLALPRDPKRPIVALVVTDGDANTGVSDNAEILSKFTRLNDGLISVYMYGVKESANRELIDLLTHGNRGEALIFDGWRWNAGDGMAKIAERFREPVLTDLRIIFASDCAAETYPRLLRNLYRNDTLEFSGKVPASAREVAFSIRGLNADKAYEGFFRLPISDAADDNEAAIRFNNEAAIDTKLR